MNSKERICKNCQKPIPETMRIDAVFCSARCGWRYRNKVKSEERLEARKSATPNPIEKNYGIIKFLFQNNRTDVSRETLREIGFDPDVHSGMRNINHEDQRTEFRIREYILTLGKDELITINKQDDEYV